MVKNRHATAVELLMSYPDHIVAEMLGVRLRTLTRWMGMREFRDALREREQSQSRALGRVARQAALRAASTLCQTAGNGDVSKTDPKILLDLLKISGAFEKSDESDSADALAEIINRATNAEEES